MTTYHDPAEYDARPPKAERCPETLSLDLFAAPAPPTGPEAVPYSKDDGKPAAYIAWRESEDGQHFMRYATGAAIVSLRERGDRRFSVLGYIHRYRMTFKRRVNNTHAPWIADDLVAARPELLTIIERRARRKEGP